MPSMVFLYLKSSNHINCYRMLKYVKFISVGYSSEKTLDNMF